MEILESKAYTTEQQKNAGDIKETEIINQKDSQEISETNKNSYIVEENMLENSPLIKPDPDISNISKSLCKIKI